ncbi:MAG: hypothetical protein HKN81_05310 [Gammaproteobacteria bacterium]|nr:hypothetical protein [Gammaproteobacteria bacterium]
MPLFDGNDAAHWAAHYSWAVDGSGNGVDTSMYAARWAQVQALGVAASDRIIVGGAGTGYLVAAAHDAGFPNCWGIDASTQLTDTPGRFQIANGVLLVDRPMQGGGGTLARLRQLTGDDEFQWVVTEDLLTCYDPSDPDVADIFAACETVLAAGEPLTQIVHLVSCDWDPAFIAAPGFSQSLAQWQALAPAHTWLEI